MTLKELENTTNLIKKYNDVFSSSIDMTKTMNKLVKRQMKEKTSMKMS